MERHGIHMDFMIGTIDAKRLRRDILRQYRAAADRRSPSARNKIELAELANEQQLVAIAKKEGIELRKYIR